MTARKSNPKYKNFRWKDLLQENASIVSPYLADTPGKPGKRDLDFVGTKSWSKGVFCLIHLLFITGVKSYA